MSNVTLDVAPICTARKFWRLFLITAILFGAVPCGAAAIPDAASVDAEVARAMAATHARGLAIAIIDQGQVLRVRSYGTRNAAGQPLQTDTIMYGASLTKTAFACMVMQLVDEKKLSLDRPLAHYLDRPLPDYTNTEHYAPWPDLAGDARWRKISARNVLTHSTGFHNFAFLEPDGKLRIHFAPGSRYSYSGAGMILLQFVIERGLGHELGALMQQRIFDRFGMRNTSMVWRSDFAHNVASGWDINGAYVPHNVRRHVRAAGSMDTTISDMARFAAGLVRGEGLSAFAHSEMIKPQLLIDTASQFPPLQPAIPKDKRRSDLAAGLGIIVFRGAQGTGFMKGGHNDSTGNTLVCIDQSRRCVVILANDVRAEPAFPHLVDFVLGETGAPWHWEYGDMKFWEFAATDKR